MIIMTTWESSSTNQIVLVRVLPEKLVPCIDALQCYDSVVVHVVVDIWVPFTSMVQERYWTSYVVVLRSRPPVSNWNLRPCSETNERQFLGSYKEARPCVDDNFTVDAESILCSVRHTVRPILKKICPLIEKVLQQALLLCTKMECTHRVV